MNAPYLRVTLHDNDFTSYWRELGEAIQSIIRFECNNFKNKKLEERDLGEIKPYIEMLWWSIDSLSSHFRWKDTHIDSSPTIQDYFKGVNIEIVDFLDIPDWDNGESIYIPLYEDSDEILCR